MARPSALAVSRFTIAQASGALSEFSGAASFET
jgi:hypothetical protein